MTYSDTQDSTLAAMQAAGVPTEEQVFVDYFGFYAEDLHYLPGSNGKVWVKLAKLNAGKKKAFQKETSKDLRVQRTTGDAIMKMDPGAEQAALLTAAIVGWNLQRRNPKNPDQIEPAPFDASNLKRFLDGADPEVLNDIEKKVRKMNPWLMDEMSVEDIDKEIANLQELREVAVRREEGNADSAS